MKPRRKLRGARASRVLVAASRRDELPPTSGLDGAPATDPTSARNRAGPLRSCLYECTVMHHRLAPKVHQFRYRIFMFALDLDEVDEVARRTIGFSYNRANLYSFRDRDHLTLPGLEQATLRENLTAYLDRNGVQLMASDRVLFVTLPRVLGYIFNPVSFYFCSDAAGAPRCAVVQVGNTFGEMKPYLLREPTEPGAFRLVTPKHFYVSPFSALDLAFDFKLRVPADTLDIHIDDRDGERRVLLSALTGRRAPLTTATLAWFTLKYPLITLRVIFLIHWHAARLWMKRLPWHRKTADAHLQQDVLRPHASIAANAP